MNSKAGQFIWNLLGGNAPAAIRTALFLIGIIWYAASAVQEVTSGMRAAIEQSKENRVLLDSIAGYITRERDEWDDYEHTIKPMVYQNHVILERHFPKDMELMNLGANVNNARSQTQPHTFIAPHPAH